MASSSNQTHVYHTHWWWKVIEDIFVSSWALPVEAAKVIALFFGKMPEPQTWIALVYTFFTYFSADNVIVSCWLRSVIHLEMRLWVYMTQYFGVSIFTFTTNEYQLWILVTGLEIICISINLSELNGLTSHILVQHLPLEQTARPVHFLSLQTHQPPEEAERRHNPTASDQLIIYLYKMLLKPHLYREAIFFRVSPPIFLL